jgi:hypothetical protein
MKRDNRIAEMAELSISDSAARLYGYIYIHERGMGLSTL